MEPTLTTVAASEITINSAKTGGNITSDGGAGVTSRGVCWGTTAQPVITGSHSTDSKGTGIFSSLLTGLTPGTTYYIRAYATNEAGTAYGNEITFSTVALTLPELTTVAVTGVTSTGAVSGGNITKDGGVEVTARGICWAATANPTVSDTKTTNGSGTGSFTANITGLTPGASYHVRAYATNSVGTAYGNDIPFTASAVTPTLTTTAITSPARTTAVSGGNITNNGGAPVTARGVCWSTSSGPLATGSHTSDGTGNGTFTSNITGLTPATTYYVRAYATNTAGTAYGNELFFTTSPVLVPTVTTTAVTGVTLTTAVSGGSITDDNGGAVTARGVCWNISGNPTASDPKTTDGSGTGSFSSNIAGLAAGTVYYVRAYATNSAGTGYGTQLRLSTSASDIDGNVYKTVVIGTQLWMQSDLKTSRLSNNASIPNVTDNNAWKDLTSMGYCWYDNNPSYGSTYVMIYNWYAVETNILCPTGWHVPTDDEFKALELSLGMTQAQVDGTLWRGTDQGTQLKS
ncbi:MAG TPA: FISUMP domain-containing protein, partial [Bacteroidales bacterium]|nr:FISUMP domain-containing protein [Bacteroidales bacterium]